MSRHPKADLYLAERAKGLTYRQIADKYGVSHQTVAMACAQYAPGHFRPFNSKQVIYPNLRKWLNDNKVCKSEFLRRMGKVGYGESVQTLGDWFRGRSYPTKQNIDLILAVTGLTYEKLFEIEKEEKP